MAQPSGVEGDTGRQNSERTPECERQRTVGTRKVDSPDRHPGPARDRSLDDLEHVEVGIGEGEAIFQGELSSGQVALEKAGLAPIELQAKEGLALTNGTALMAATGVLATLQAENLAAVAVALAILYAGYEIGREAIHGGAAELRNVPATAASVS